jgi:DNA-binding response OmpR family regulator
VADTGGNLWRLLHDTLEAGSFQVTEVAHSAKLIRVLRSQSFDLVILDAIGLPDHAIRHCRQIRLDTPTPVIVVVPSFREDLMVAVLDAGADDCVTDPFSIQELLARIRSVMRRTSSSRIPHGQSGVIRFNGWSLDPAGRLLVGTDGRRADLTAAEFDLLLILCRNPGRILSREELLFSTHAGQAGPIERSVDVHISRLRRKIELDPSNPMIVKTVRLAGYLFTGRLEAVPG